MTNINDKLASIKKSLEKSDVKVVDKETEKLKTVKKPVRGKNGGARPNSGRKPLEQTLVKKGIRQIVDAHASEEVEVLVTDRGTNKTVKLIKPRALIVMEILYKIGTKDNNVGALKEWLDRSMGKAPQPIKGDENDDTPIRLEHNITGILEKTYDTDEQAE